MEERKITAENKRSMSSALSAELDSWCAPTMACPTVVPRASQDVSPVPPQFSEEEPEAQRDVTLSRHTATSGQRQPCADDGAGARLGSSWSMICCSLEKQSGGL